MRKLIRLLAVISLVAFTAGIAYAIPQPSDPGDLKGPIGNRKSTPRKVYHLVRYAEQAQNAVPIASGEVVVWDMLSDDAVTIDVTTTSADNSVAGIAVTSIETADAVGNSAFDHESNRNWGYIQVYGKALARVQRGGANNNTAGAPFITSTDSGAITTLEGVLSSDSVRRNIVNGLAEGGFFMDAADAGTEERVEVFVQLE